MDHPQQIKPLGLTKPNQTRNTPPLIRLNTVLWGSPGTGAEETQIPRPDARFPEFGYECLFHSVLSHDGVTVAG